MNEEAGLTRPLRIAYVIPELRPGSGWRVYATGLLGALHNLGVEPVLFVQSRERQRVRELFPDCPAFGLPSVHFPAPSDSWRDLRLLRTYFGLRLGRFPAVDLVQSMEAFPTGLVGHWLARRLQTPHVVVGHGTYAVIWHRSRFDRFVFHRVLRGANAVVTGSQETAARMERYFEIAMSKSTRRTILYGNDHYEKVSRVDALEGRDEPIVLSVGSVKSRKGFHVSLRAFGEVKKRVPRARYLIVGALDDGAYHRELRRYVADRGIDGVEFLGRVSDAELERLYRRSSVFLLAPQEEGERFEGFGLVFVEAGAYGLPVVATRTGGVASAVRDGITGFLCGADDVGSIADRVERLLSDRALAARLGRANRDWAETLTWERAAREYVSLYLELLADHPS